MAEEKKKGLFGKAIDALSSRDEKAAAEEAAKKAAEAKAQAAKAAAEKAAAQKQAQEAKARAAQAEAKAKKLEQEKRLEEARKVQEQRAKEQAARIAGAMPKIKAEHTVKAGETLSDIALKHYGKAIKDYWMLIYETNKATIGSSPSVIREGMVLKIPELPADLKK